MPPFQCKSGEVVEIQIDEADYTVEVHNSDGGRIGGLRFSIIDEEAGEHLKLTWAFLDKLGSGYLRQGIGTECLRRVKDLSGTPITAESDDGQKRDDGSHLTGDAPAFVARMRREGLIEQAQFGAY